jgi:hypothetical protein
MEDSSPHRRLAIKDNIRGGRVGGNVASGSPSSQETEDDPDKDKVDR